MQMHADMPTVSARFRSHQQPNFGDILRRCDDPLHWQAPRGFERNAALRSFRTFLNNLQECLGHRLDYETSETLDEATFHAEIFLATGSLRFSNFGKLVAFVGEGLMPARFQDAVNDLADEPGYTLVPHEALDARYAGCHTRGGCESWQQRFFE